MKGLALDIIASSSPLRFLVGPSQREFTIHSALLSHRSLEPERFESNISSQAVDKCVKWESVDEDTFVRFWQSIYTGGYNAAAPVVGPLWDTDIAHELHSIPPSVSEPSFDVMDTQSNNNVPSRNMTIRRKSLWRKFKNWQSSTLSNDFLMPAKSNSINEDYTDTFLSHARLCMFAESYYITDLMHISLNELHNLLVAFNLFNERVNDIVTLICCCYDNASPRPLRELVTLYAACKMKQLWLSKHFQKLVETHGELSRALIELMLTEQE
ncbi:hypothetical protein V8C37DRAFT_412557 [Trichoderma ceciliae]